MGIHSGENPLAMVQFWSNILNRAFLYSNIAARESLPLLRLNHIDSFCLYTHRLLFWEDAGERRTPIARRPAVAMTAREAIYPEGWCLG
jgi:hypothetical protein